MQLTLGSILKQQLINYKVYLEEITENLTNHHDNFQMACAALDMVSTILDSLHSSPLRQYQNSLSYDVSQPAHTGNVNDNRLSLQESACQNIWQQLGE